MDYFLSKKLKLDSSKLFTVKGYNVLFIFLDLNILHSLEFCGTNLKNVKARYDN
jgi:hypothetical protein